MKEIVIAHAHGYVGEPVEDVTIRLTGEPPDFPGDDYVWLYHDYYGAQGKLLCDTLLNTLPGGTVDALLYHLLMRKANVFRVPAYRMEEAA